MKRNYNISVAMATYNGETYIKEQIDSILKQLTSDDELVISDDGSTDKTSEIINSYNDKRIKLVDGPHKGVKQNFANAIEKCKGNYIFLCDQDDVWLDGKIEKVLRTFETRDCQCVIHDSIVFDSDSNTTIYDSFYKWRRSKSGIIKNILKNSYIGCCMAFSKNLKDKILPIPNDIEMHDQWIGLICEKYGESIFIKDALIKYRRHNKNVSNMHHYGFMKMLKNRLILIKNVLWR